MQKSTELYLFLKKRGMCSNARVWLYEQLSLEMSVQQIWVRAIHTHPNWAMWYLETIKYEEGNPTAAEQMKRIAIAILEYLKSDQRLNKYPRLKYFIEIAFELGFGLSRNIREIEFIATWRKYIQSAVHSDYNDRENYLRSALDAVFDVLYDGYTAWSYSRHLEVALNIICAEFREVKAALGTVIFNEIPEVPLPDLNYED